MGSCADDDDDDDDDDDLDYSFKYPQDRQRRFVQNLSVCKIRRIYILDKRHFTLIKLLVPHDQIISWRSERSQHLQNCC